MFFTDHLHDLSSTDYSCSVCGAKGVRLYRHNTWWGTEALCGTCACHCSGIASWEISSKILQGKEAPIPHFIPAIPMRSGGFWENHQWRDEEYASWLSLPFGSASAEEGELEDENLPQW